MNGSGFSNHPRLSQAGATLPDLEYIFHPRSVAVAGVSNKPTNMGRLLMRPLLSGGFRGQIYPLNRRGGETDGLKIYTSLQDVPGPVDYLITSIPARETPRLMEECVAKGVKVVSFFTAGFSELGEDEGRRLEDAIAEIARRGGVRILGPNCWGMCCPESGLSFVPDPPKRSGPVGFISQSGGSSSYMLRVGSARGVRFSKVISYGNARDLNESDFIDYLTHDPATEIITAYIEGIRDARRFMSVFREAAGRKPVIVLKGGRTKAGSRATASHTGSLAVADSAWDSFLRQTKAIRAYSIEELIDAVLPFSWPSLPAGRNIAIIGFSGGANVQAADDCESAGLVPVELPTATRETLKGIVGQAGSIVRNPVDITNIGFRPAKINDTIRIVAGLAEVDVLLLHFLFDSSPLSGDDQRQYEPAIDAFIDSVGAANKPAVMVLQAPTTPESRSMIIRAQEKFVNAGIPTYPSFRRAASAIAKAIRYRENRGEAL